MKRFLKWTAAILAVGAGSLMTMQAIQAARRRVRNALGQAEAVAAKTRETLEETETALRKARNAV